MASCWRPRARTGRRRCGGCPAESRGRGGGRVGRPATACWWFVAASRARRKWPRCSLSSRPLLSQRHLQILRQRQELLGGGGAGEDAPGGGIAGAGDGVVPLEEADNLAGAVVGAHAVDLAHVGPAAADPAGE